MLPTATALRTLFPLKPQVQMTQDPHAISINIEKKMNFNLSQQQRGNTSLDKKPQRNRISKTSFSKALYWFPGDPPEPCCLITKFKRAQAAPVLEVCKQQEHQRLFQAAPPGSQHCPGLRESKRTQNISTLSLSITPKEGLNGLRAEELSSRKFCLF